jgi:hypothetical protein
MSRLPGAYRGRARQSAHKAARARVDAQLAELAGAPPPPSEYLTVAEMPRPNRALAAQFPAWGEAADFAPAVIELIRQLGLGYHHEGISIGTESGWLDIFVWLPRGPGGHFTRELKGSGHKVKFKRAQLDRINSMRAAGIDADVRWPEDWHLGIFQGELHDLAEGRWRPPGPLPPLVGQGQPGAAAPVRDPSKRYAKCGCEIVDGRIPDHTCRWYGGPGQPWKAAR